MSIESKQSLIVSASQTDVNARLGVIQALTYAQDNMCKLFYDLDCDGIRLTKSHHAFWAVTKTKVDLSGEIKWLDNVEITTKITCIKPIRLNLETIIFNDFGQVKITQEIVAMDSENRKVRMINSIPNFPSADSIENDNIYKFDSLRLDDVDYRFVGEIKVDSNMIDYFEHTNNIAYARIILGTMDAEFLKDFKPKNFEIHYLKETRYLDVLKVYKYDSDGNILFKICKDDEIVCLAKLNY